MDFSLGLFDPKSSSIYVLVGAGSVIILSIVVFLILVPLRNKMNPMRRAGRNYDRARYERALVLLALELERNPENRQALLMRADAEKALGRFPDAARDYHRLIHLKKPGDGIDVLDVKKRLLEPLYREQSLLELHTTCSEILKIEATSPEATYYMGLLYLGQMYYDRAARVLAALVRNRPNMAEAQFALGLSQLQRSAFDDAVRALNRALSLLESTLHRICTASAYYFAGNYRQSLDMLRTVPQRQDSFDTLKQYLFSLKLRAFCHYKTGRYERAVQLLQVYYNHGKREGGTAAALYTRDGSLQAVAPNESVSSDFGDYYRLKEVAAEEGVRRVPGNTRRIHDLEGLTRITEAAIDLGFAMVRAGLLREATEHLTRVRSEHPEILGLGRILHLLEVERERESALEGNDPGRFRAKSTERVVKGGGRGFKLWEYLEEWERNAIRPYQLLVISEFTASKMLSPRILSGGWGEGVG
jgi:tetratricopeptide (TPR) repeat protein